MPKRKYTYFFVITSLVLLLSLVGLTGCPGGSQTYTLTTNVSPPGAGSISPSGGNYDSGMSVTLTATPASGYTFDYWSGSASGSNPTTTIIMNSDKSVTAYFEAAQVTERFTLTTNVSPSGAGSISPSGGEYDSGATVTLTASAESGYNFVNWSGSASGTNSTTTITMDSDKSVTANFETTGPAVLLSDDFSNPGSGWATYDGSDGRVAYRDGYLYIKDYTSPAQTIYSDYQLYLTDFILEVETWMVGGNDDNWHLVQCRYQGEQSYYDFGVSADGYYDIIKFVNGNKTTLVSPTYSSYINQGVGAVNVIHIECIGSSLSLSVNGHLLASVTDTTFSGGDICLAANALAGTYTEVAFDNIIVTAP